ncbi:TELO2-interacting protein 1-like [Oopsacas minuta]|uniref:TELO2-interacting protein 1-like n=1 Tax=Oopsacas minuta TaxID=111878 RepID=A0AAV7JVC2_9METZ|nr:TELO2-interacting protein 1-like [Oopsacas minuta]
MDREEAEAQFFRVKLACGLFRESPSAGTLKTMLESVKDEDRIHYLVGSYVIYPLCIHMRNSEIKLPENFIELAFKIIHHTLKRTNIAQINGFLDIFGTFCFFLDSELPNYESKVTISEEIKIQILMSISALFKSTDSDVLRKFYSETSYKKQLGLLIHLMLKELEIKQGNKIPFLVINNLMSLLNTFCQFRPVRYTPNKVLFNTALQYDFLWTSVRKCTESFQIQKVMVFFIPGITSKLVHFITTHVQPSASLIAAVILTFANFIVYTCNNKFYKHILEQESPPPHDLEKEELYVNLNKDWWERTSIRLSSLYVSTTQICIAHENFKTRLCLLEAAAVMLGNCQISLPILMTSLIDTLIVLSADTNKFVSDSATKMISTFSNLPELNSFNSLLLRIEELTYSLPKIAHNLNDSNKLPILRLLSGYLKLIGKIQLKIGNTNIRMKECIKNLVKTFISVLEFDISDNTILNQVMVLSAPKTEDLSTLKIIFTNLGDKSVKAIIDILHTIGMYCVFESILSYIFELSEKEHIRKELVFILNHLIVGSVETQSIELVTNTIETVIPIYLQSEWFEDLDRSAYALVKNRANFDEEINIPTIFALKDRTIQQILILEGLGHFAVSLGMNFQPFLVTTIFPLLEKSNNSNPHLQAQSYDSLQKLCLALKYPSVQNLIHDNADYITNVISLQFFQECTSQSALDVLQAVFRNSSVKLLALLEDSVSYLLKSIRFYHSHDESVVLLPTLVVISQQLFNWQYTEDDDVIITSDNSTECFLNEYEDYIHYYHPQEDDQVTNPSPENPQESSDLVEHNICVEIIDSISYYTNFPTAKVTTFAIRVITNCILALRSNQERSLPILHRIWPQFLACTKTNYSIILIASLECLALLAHYFGHFLRSRIEKDLWPFFISSFKRLVDQSKNSTTYYLHTQDYKSQLALLHTIPNIAFDLKIHFPEFHKLLSVYHPYCSLSQPRELRAKAIEGIAILAQINPESVYLLKTLLQPSEYGNI